MIAVTDAAERTSAFLEIAVFESIVQPTANPLMRSLQPVISLTVRKLQVAITFGQSERAVSLEVRNEKRPGKTFMKKKYARLKRQKHVASARHLLTELRNKLRQVENYPELQEAITKLEVALSTLTVKTGGML